MNDTQTQHMITVNDITVNDRYRLECGTVVIVDKIENQVVHSSLEGGEKGNYCDTLTDFVDFLNEEKAQKI